MNIAIIGAGFTGLSAAYYLLKQGHRVTVFEKDPQPGGLAIGYQEKGWDWTLEAFYHHWFTNDKAILDLAKELNYPVLIKRPKTSQFIDGNIYQLDSPLTLLSFKKLSLHERLQMGIVLAFLRFNPFWKPLERITATAFLSKTMKPSQNSLFKAETSVRRVAESGILGLVHRKKCL
jgi:protoporphyrinogen oxidase